MRLRSTAIYDRRASSLAARYESTSFETVHAPILDLIPRPPALVLDIGAGSGRDSAALAGRGLDVVAVEPSSQMRIHAQRLHRGEPITWINDRLPHLNSLRHRVRKFDFILVSAVWMHLRVSERPLALRALARLLKESGVLVITLRFGRVDPVRRFFATSVEELMALAAQCNLATIRITELGEDKLRRRTVSWRTAALRISKPDVESSVLA